MTEPSPTMVWKRDPGKLTWSRPDSVIAPFCSACFAHIGEDDIPLKFWNEAGACVQLCDACVKEWIRFK